MQCDKDLGISGVPMAMPFLPINQRQRQWQLPQARKSPIFCSQRSSCGKNFLLTSVHMQHLHILQEVQHLVPKETGAELSEKMPGYPKLWG